MPKYQYKQYLETEFFQDRDLEIRNQRRRIVKTRKVHRRAFADVVQKPHDISAGTECLNERAFVEGQPGAWYACFECLDTWLDEINRVGEN